MKFDFVSSSKDQILNFEFRCNFFLEKKRDVDDPHNQPSIEVILNILESTLSLRIFNLKKQIIKN